MFERILLPLEGSELSEMVLPYGEELASRLGSEVILYHVRGHEHQQQEHMHQTYLNRLAENVQSNIKKGQPKSTEVKVTTKVEVGEPTENICNFVDKNKVDLIIMTAVSASGLKIGKMQEQVNMISYCQIYQGRTADKTRNQASRPPFRTNRTPARVKRGDSSRNNIGGKGI